LFTAEERVAIIQDLVKEYPNVSVESFDGLLVDYARRIDASIIIRGLRAVTDFDYEIQIAQTNRVEYSKLETIFMTTSLKYSYLSSTVVREFASYGGDISQFVPAEIIPLIQEKYNS
jgi:pantetheine-phosphate adenylyltransferase